ncbi:hypothetical protein BJV78DRAFT_522756 [Lactifluus subvellereus]|nr:hypothetical protein BJV78DRAFT_522756 [Lactifluus subvellereus]
MPLFRKRDRQNGAGRDQGNETSQRPGNISWSNSSQSTQEAQHNSAAVGQPPFLGAVQGVNLSQGGLSPQQGNFAQHVLPANVAVAGGFMQPSSPTSPTRVAQQDGSAHPGAFAPLTGEPQVPPPSVEQDECYTWFLAVDQDGNGQLSSGELRSALLNDRGLRFSIKTVEYLMSIFDLDGSGGIGFQEFEPLWNYMTQWRQIFDSFDTDHDGRIDASELGRALSYYDLHVGPTGIDMLVKKYGTTTPQNRHRHDRIPPRPYVDLDHFVCACVVVRQIYGLYDKCSAGEAGQTPMTRDEFFQAVISLP